VSEAINKIEGADELEGRVHPLLLRQRLGIEADHEARVFGQGRSFFHPENWDAFHSVIRLALRLCGLHDRGRRNALDLRVRNNRIDLPHLPAAFDGFTMLQLSDLHLDVNAELGAVLAERIRGLDYDAAVLTGDFRGRTHGPSEPALEMLERLHSVLRSPAYAVLGNHDSIRMVPRIEGMGIRVLLNEWVSLERSGARIGLAGVDDPHYYQSDNLERARADLPDEIVSILLAHSPEIYRHAAHIGFDVLLCGHTHGGQICLPGGVPILTNTRCPRGLCAGRWRYHGMAGYTSVGSGTAMVDVRLNCPPEVTLHVLRRSEERTARSRV